MLHVCASRFWKSCDAWKTAHCSFSGIAHIADKFFQKLSAVMSLVVRKPAFVYAKTKTQISCAVTAQLISAFVFAIRIVQSLYYLNPKFKASSHLLWLYRPVFVGPGRKPRRSVFSQRGSYTLYHIKLIDANKIKLNLQSCNFKLIWQKLKMAPCF